MATALVAADVVALTDRLGAIWKRNQDILTATPATDIATTGITDLIADVNGLGIAKNYPYGKAALDLKSALAVAGVDASIYLGFLRALNSDLGGFDAYATAQALMYYEWFRNLAVANSVAVSPANTFKGTNQTLASFAVTGATTGTFTPGTALDTTLYGAVQAEVIVTTLIGGTDLVATLTLTPPTGAAQTKTVTIPANSAVNAVFPVGASTDRYTACTAVSITGGTSGAFSVRNKVLRTPVL